MTKYLTITTGKNKIEIDEINNIVKAERFVEESIYFENCKTVLCRALNK